MSLRNAPISINSNKFEELLKQIIRNSKILGENPTDDDMAPLLEKTMNNLKEAMKDNPTISPTLFMDPKFHAALLTSLLAAKNDIKLDHALLFKQFSEDFTAEDKAKLQIEMTRFLVELTLKDPEGAKRLGEELAKMLDNDLVTKEEKKADLSTTKTVSLMDDAGNVLAPLTGQTVRSGMGLSRLTISGIEETGAVELFNGLSAEAQALAMRPELTLPLK